MADRPDGFMIRQYMFRMRALSCCLSLLAASLVSAQQPALHQLRRASAFIGYSEQSGTALHSTADRPAGHAEFAPHIILTTAKGQIRIRPRADLSPKVVQLVHQLAIGGKCAACKFYRHEPVPQNWGEAGFVGPPYALLQGSLADLAEEPPFGGHEVKKGDVAMIPRCKEFFVATADHSEWGKSHTVWGHVDAADTASWRTIDAMPFEPYTSRTDGGNITTRWLTQEATLPFTLSVEAAEAAVLTS